MIKKPAYKDRHDAGRQLASKLLAYHDQPDVLVLGLPRGGVAVAYEIALALHAPLDVFVVRKLGMPGHEEYAVGAIASGGVRVMNPLPGWSLTPSALAPVLAREELELARREQLYRENLPPLSLAGRTVILVDDGLATGATLRAAAVAVRQQHPARVIAAVPVGARDSCRDFADEVDELICPVTPEPFFAVSLWYEHIPQASDEEVRTLLHRARQEHSDYRRQVQRNRTAARHHAE